MTKTLERACMEGSVRTEMVLKLLNIIACSNKVLAFLYAER